MMTHQPHPGLGWLALLVAHPLGRALLVSWYMWKAMPICLRLLEHLARAAASRTFWTAGRSNPIRIAMIAITTNNSISVNPRRSGEGAPRCTRQPDMSD